MEPADPSPPPSTGLSSVHPSGPSSGPVPTYLDAVSSEPLHPAAREAWLAAMEAGYADPLRLHGRARQARLLLDNARAVVAECLGVRPEEVTFTGSGTQAVHLGVLGLLAGRARTGDRLAVTAVEHSAVFAAGRWWQQQGHPAPEMLPVDATGRVDLDAVAAAAAAGPLGAVAVQLANPEVGTVQPVAEVAERAAGAPVFMDACASGGYLPLPPGWACAALSAHKWGGPAGVGVLLVRRGTRWRAPLPTDERVDPRAPGFENIPAALAAAAALQVRVADRETLAATHRESTRLLRTALAAIPDVEVHGDPDASLPHLVSFSCLYVDGEALVGELDRLGFSVASGSACTASALEPSHVLVAMGALTHGNVRVSFTPSTSTEDVGRLAAALPGVVADLRARIGA